MIGVKLGHVWEAGPQWDLSFVLALIDQQLKAHIFED